MDSANQFNSNRKFPGYTLAQLEHAIANPRPLELPHSPEYMAERKKIKEMMVKEIEDRKSGKSKHFRTPQVGDK